MLRRLGKARLVLITELSRIGLKRRKDPTSRINVLERLPSTYQLATTNVCIFEYRVLTPLKLKHSFPFDTNSILHYQGSVRDLTGEAPYENLARGGFFSLAGFFGETAARMISRPIVRWRRVIVRTQEDQ